MIFDEQPDKSDRRYRVLLISECRNFLYCWYFHSFNSEIWKGDNYICIDMHTFDIISERNPFRIMAAAAILNKMDLIPCLKPGRNFK